MTLPRYEASFKAVIRKYKNNAELRGIPFQLGPSTFRSITEQDCTYCGAKPTPSSLHIKKFNGAWRWNGIDRVDSSKGYIYGNVVPCCSLCNKLKSNLEQSDFLDQLFLIVNHLWGSITED